MLNFQQLPRNWPLFTLDLHGRDAPGVSATQAADMRGASARLWRGSGAAVTSALAGASSTWAMLTLRSSRRSSARIAAWSDPLDMDGSKVCRPPGWPIVFRSLVQQLVHGSYSAVDLNAISCVFTSRTAANTDVSALYPCQPDGKKTGSRARTHASQMVRTQSHARPLSTAHTPMVRTLAHARPLSTVHRLTRARSALQMVRTPAHLHTRQ